ncbi:amidase signature enzyme [Calocera viscosa TUFC12733]|uniref:amidase n=1 Tax=Calocera viscosa (strain TUFC12733) TaxID=1330018 RepID=A0A167S9H2_CALVF|nr:amidase signature enzyme [Calocera viscosa TUFC12733]
MWLFDSSWKDIAARKQADRAALIEAAKELLRSCDLALSDAYLRASAGEIIAHLSARTPGWTAERVTAAYISQAIDAHAATNCITEVLFQEALEAARALDKEYEATGTLKGPLHGVPVSFKDQYDVKGYDSSIGFSQWAYKPAKEDALLVAQVKAAGGIPICKTNVPQTMLSFECNNPLFGRTLNPWSPAHIPGGSSGGEAVLLACGGSALGFGSDIGGSLRIPTGLSGCFAIKCGEPRFSKTGAVSPNPGFETIRTIMGPMARSVADVKLACQTICGLPGGASEHLAPVPWRDVQLPKKLKIGYYTSDNVAENSPPVKRAVREAVAALTKAGHECVQFVPPNALEAMECFTALTSSDGYKELTSHLGPDPQDPSLFLVLLGPSIPWFIRSTAAWLLRTAVGDERFATLLAAARHKPVREFVHWTARRNELIDEFHAKVWAQHAFDFVLAPVQAMPALPHKATRTLIPLASATIYYNVLHYPAGVVPVTRVLPTDVWAEEAEDPGSVMLRTEMRKVYDPEAMKGLPVGVQLVGRPWEDERVVEAMGVLDAALGPRGFGPGTWTPAV